MLLIKNYHPKELSNYRGFKMDLLGFMLNLQSCINAK